MEDFCNDFLHCWILESNGGRNPVVIFLNVAMDDGNLGSPGFEVHGFVVDIVELRPPIWA